MRRIKAISGARVLSSLRLAAQDVALSRRKQGFESPRERQRHSSHPYFRFRGLDLSPRACGCQGLLPLLITLMVQIRPLPTRGCGRPPSEIAMITTISSGRGASSLEIVTVAR